MNTSILKIILIPSVALVLCLLALYFFQVAHLIESSYLLSASQAELAGLARQNSSFDGQTNKVSSLSAAEKGVIKSGFIKVAAVKFIPITNDYLAKGN